MKRISYEMLKSINIQEGEDLHTYLLHGAESFLGS